jgi:hypothetical protein
MDCAVWAPPLVGTGMENIVALFFPASLDSGFARTMRFAYTVMCPSYRAASANNSFLTAPGGGF